MSAAAPGTVIVVTGTDTDVGKSMVAAGLAACLPGASYWKPVQAGLEPESDRQRVAALSGLPPERLLPEVYCLRTPASPHLAARLDGLAIEPERLVAALPRCDGPLVVEGAGGVLVPLTDDGFCMADLFARWGVPVVLVARTGLGTINHSLLSIEALRARGVPIAGLVFSGAAHEENERIVPRLGGVRSLGRVPLLDPLDAASLRAAVLSNIALPHLTSAVPHPS